MARVDLEKLQIRLGARTIIEQLSLAIADGEFLVLLGPSGCGKSTLLHAIAGLAEVASGCVRIAGEDVTGADPAARNIGMVFQSYALYPTMTVERNLSFGLRVRGLPRAEIRERVERAAELLQLTPLLGRKPAALSGGQRQRVAIGRALVREARVYLFDEPLSNLDANLRGTLRRELKALHRRLAATMVYVTHDQVEAMTLATRIAVMKDGALQQVGTPAEVYGAPANRFVAGFLGAPGMNFIEGDVEESPTGPRFVAPGLEIGLESYRPGTGALAAGPATLGVRPEHLRPGLVGTPARVTMVEPMGAHQVLTLDCTGQTLLALDHDQCAYREGESVCLRIDATQLSLFDRHTGSRL